jgi:hypothetical protein
MRIRACHVTSLGRFSEHLATTRAAPGNVIVQPPKEKVWKQSRGSTYIPALRLSASARQDDCTSHHYMPVPKWRAKLGRSQGPWERMVVGVCYAWQHRAHVPGTRHGRHGIVVYCTSKLTVPWAAGPRLPAVGTLKQYFKVLEYEYRVKTATLGTLKRYSILSLTLYLEWYCGYSILYSGGSH